MVIEVLPENILYLHIVLGCMTRYSDIDVAKNPYRVLPNLLDHYANPTLPTAAHAKRNISTRSRLLCTFSILSEKHSR